MFVKITIIVVSLAMANLAEGTPTCAQITKLTAIANDALKGTNLSPAALRLGWSITNFIR